MNVSCEFKTGNDASPVSLLKGFMYKYGHACDLKTITPLEGQVRKRINMNLSAEKDVKKALLCLRDEQIDT